MTELHARELGELETVCRQLAEARGTADRLEQRRNELIRALRAAGVTGAQLAALTGLTAGRVAQITNHSAAPVTPPA